VTLAWQLKVSIQTHFLPPSYHWTIVNVLFGQMYVTFKLTFRIHLFNNPYTLEKRNRKLVFKGVGQGRVYFVIASSNTLASRVRQNKRALHPNFFRCEACKNWMGLFLLELVWQSAGHCINSKFLTHKTKALLDKYILISFAINMSMSVYKWISYLIKLVSRTTATCPDSCLRAYIVPIRQWIIYVFLEKGTLLIGRHMAWKMF
jgi:hypothetical protein